ncbi:MAG TPA: dUTP diphosphatase [Acidimicrobiia bacterium]|nr:dUTP diphosphatase [Acidimicrobiia bacterium]
MPTLAYSRGHPAQGPEAPMQVNFVRLDRELPIPVTAHIGDAAVDLHSRVDVTLKPGERASVPTGIAVAIPAGHAGLVLPRSGHAARHGVGVVNGPGLIDSGYRGEISVLLINHGSEAVTFSRGERIAQLAIVPVPEVTWVEAESLDETRRGGGGFGSTGR